MLQYCWLRVQNEGNESIKNVCFGVIVLLAKLSNITGKRDVLCGVKVFMYTKKERNRTYFCRS